MQDRGRTQIVVIGMGSVALAAAAWWGFRKYRNKQSLVVVFRPIHEATQKGDLETVRRLIEEEGVDPCQLTHPQKASLLHLAMFPSDPAMIKYLLTLPKLVERHLNLQAHEGGGTPLHGTCSLNTIEVLKVMLEQPGIDMSVKNDAGSTPLAAACHRGNDLVVRELSQRCGDQLRQQETGGNLLHIPVVKGHLKVVQELFEAGFGTDLNELSPEECNRNVLQNACLHARSVDLVKFLIEKGADVNLRSGDGVSPLHYALFVFPDARSEAEANKPRDRGPKIFKELLEHGADLYVTSKEDRATPLHRAVLDGHSHLVELVLEEHSKLQKERAGRQTPTNGEDKEVVGEVEKDFLNLRLHPHNCNALDVACDQGNVEMVKLLLKHGADKNLEYQPGVTPRKLAARKGHLKIVELLK